MVSGGEMRMTLDTRHECICEVSVRLRCEVIDAIG